MKLPNFNTKILELTQMQSAWASIIEPFLSRPSNSSNILKNVVLVTGVNYIEHKLGRPLQGWKIVRQRASAAIYDNQDSNVHPEATLWLVSSANVVIDLEIF